MDLLCEMKRQDKRLVYTTFVLIVSAFGLIVSVSLVSSSDTSAVASGVRRSSIMLAYATVSSCGIVAVLFPSACSGILGTKKTLTKNTETPAIHETRVFGLRLVHCHHFGAEMGTHELQIKGKSYCATCFGLLTGAIFSMVSVGIFATYGWPSRLDLSYAYGLYFLGVAGPTLGLILAHGSHLRPRVRFALSAFFVVGTGFTLIATDTLTGSMTADVLVILLAVFWVLSRVSLSQ